MPVGVVVNACMCAALQVRRIRSRQLCNSNILLPSCFLKYADWWQVALPDGLHAASAWQARTTNRIMTAQQVDSNLATQTK